MFSQSPSIHLCKDLSPVNMKVGTSVKEECQDYSLSDETNFYII